MVILPFRDEREIGRSLRLDEGPAVHNRRPNPDPDPSPMPPDPDPFPSPQPPLPPPEPSPVPPTRPPIPQLETPHLSQALPLSLTTPSYSRQRRIERPKAPPQAHAYTHSGAYSFFRSFSPITR